MNDQQHDSHVGRVEAHRLDGFIDAAFAFAVSVLAIAGAEVPHSLHDLMSALDRIPAFACSFATLMIFWHRHVRWRDRFRLHDTTSMMLSLMLVFFALIFVYPLNMLFQAMFSSLYEALAHQELSGSPTITSVHDVKALYLCYALAYACMAGCLVCLYRHSLRKVHLQHPERIEAREVMYTQSGSLCVALLSLCATLLIPETPAWAPLPGFIYMLISPMYWIAGRWARRAKESVA
ncbi:TMEM175 family protein [Dyella psychrodurans]|nr:TMEM175 family protein [Dyella psychrodurans]